MRNPDLAPAMDYYLSLRKALATDWKPSENEIAITKQQILPSIETEDAPGLEPKRVRAFLQLLSLEVQAPKPELLRAAVCCEALAEFKMIPYYLGERGLPGLIQARQIEGFIIGHDLIYGYSAVACALGSGLDYIAGKSQLEIINITGQLDQSPLEIAELISQWSFHLVENAKSLESDSSGRSLITARKDAILRGEFPIPDFLVREFVTFGAELAAKYYERFYSLSNHLAKNRGPGKYFGLN